MPIRKKAKLGIVNFIHPEDSAIDLSIDEETGKPVSNIEAYREDWDFEKHCALVEGQQPTIFKINFEIPFKKVQQIKNATLGGFGNKNEEAGFKYGNHSAQVVKSVLVDIVNPDDLPLADRIIFKQDKKTGLVKDDVLEELEKCGVLDDIYSFYLTNKDDPAESLKKR